MKLETFLAVLGLIVAVLAVGVLVEVANRIH
jgi:hypothetical protein